MSSIQLTPRQQREVAFYREYAQRQRVDRVDFDPVSGTESRPWNAYWSVYEQAAVLLRHPGARLLEFGCGIGIAAVRFAHLGYYVSGFDISEDNIRIARELAEHHGLSHRCDFRVMPAEQLDYPDGHFDVITGIDILHHIEIDRSAAEAARVLKADGTAIFKEHIESPIIDPVRNTRLVQAIAPTESSLDDHITEDERKLSQADLATIRSAFGKVDPRHFTLLGRAERLLPRSSASIRGILQRVDHTLLTYCPFLDALAGTVVLTCAKPVRAAAGLKRAA